MKLTPQTHAQEREQGTFWHVFLNDVDVSSICFYADDKDRDVRGYVVGKDGKCKTKFVNKTTETTTMGDVMHKFSPWEMATFRSTGEKVRIEKGEDNYPPVTYADYLKATGKA